MAEFKPMVKMMTTEPSVELKLKKGGHVKMKAKEHDGHKMMDGGVPPSMPTAMPARGGMPMAAAPMKPSLAMRRKAMRAMSPAAPAGPVGMAGRMLKKGGEAESKAEHKAEMKGIKKVEKELKAHEKKPASKAHKGMKTGGVAMGQSGFKEGGIINTEGQGGKYRTTKMNTAERTTKTSGKTGEVKNGNGGGFKKGGRCYAKGGGVEGNVSTTPAGKTGTTTGEVKLGNAGGFKKGGKAKKMADGGASKKAVDGAKSGTGTVTEVERQIVRKVTPKKSSDSRDVQSNDMTPSGTPLNPEFLKDYLKAPHYKKGGKTKKYADGGMVQGAPIGLPSVSPAGRVGLPPVSASGRIYDPNSAMLTQQPGGQPMPVGYATGGSVNDEGEAVKMPQRRPARPVSINQLSGTYKKGGRVK